MLLVCLQIEMRIKENEEESRFFSREWTLGPCHGPRLGWNYSPNKIHFEKCCLVPGNYTLTCTNLQSKYGWGNVIFEIDGNRYCDDFVGFKAMRKVFAKGKQ